MTDDELLHTIRGAIQRDCAVEIDCADDPLTVVTADGREVMVEIRLFDVTGAR